MKKQIALTLAASMVISLAACGKETAPATEVQPETQLETQTEIQTEPAVDPFTDSDMDNYLETIQWATEALMDMEVLSEPVEETWETEPPVTLPKNFTALEEPETVYATQDVNIREKPTVNSKSLGKLLRGERAQRLGTSKDGWSAVELDMDQQLRYISSKYLTTTDPLGGSGESTGSKKVTETASGGTFYTSHWVNLRQGPGADTALLGTVPEGAVVQSLAVCSNGWYKISYGGAVGYVAGGYLTTKVPAGGVITPPAESGKEEAQTEETKEDTETDNQDQNGTGTGGTGTGGTGTGSTGTGGTGTGGTGTGGTGTGGTGTGGTGTGGTGTGGTGTGGTGTGGTGTGGTGTGGTGTGGTGTGGTGTGGTGTGGTGTGGTGTGGTGTGGTGTGGTGTGSTGTGGTGTGGTGTGTDGKVTDTSGGLKTQ